LKYIHFVVPRKTCCLVKNQTWYIRFEDVFFFYFLTFQTMKCLSDWGIALSVTTQPTPIASIRSSSLKLQPLWDRVLIILWRIKKRNTNFNLKPIDEFVVIQ
jgi:hypothetical protein